MSAYSTVAVRGLFRTLDLTLARQEKRVTDEYRKLVAGIFADIVIHTPQFTGNLAQGWQLEFGPHIATEPNKYSDSYRYKQVYKRVRDEWEPYKRGANPAVTDTLSRELPKLESLRWNSVVKIVNHIKYADAVEAGQGPEFSGQQRDIRPENLYRGKIFMASYAQQKYSKLGNLLKIVKK